MPSQKAQVHPNTNMSQNKPSRQNEIEAVLNTLLQNDGFICAVVASKEGLPFAMVGSTDTILLAAVAATIKDTAKRIQQSPSEVAIRNNSGEQIVIRYFNVDDERLLLSINIVVGRTYRRLTSRAIRQIQQILSKS